MRSGQKGVVLIVGLILLVVMTILGITVIRNVTTEERMAGNAYNRSLSFQAVEATLTSVELLLEANKPTITAGCALTSGVMMCAKPSVGDTPRWQDSAFTSWQDASAVSSGAVSVTPQYFVEYLGASFPCAPGDPADSVDCKRYRITARTQSTGGQAPVVLQSIYATD